MINDIKNTTITEANPKKKINELNKIKKTEIKDKRLINGQKILLNLFGDLIETIFNNFKIVNEDNNKIVNKDNNKIVNEDNNVNDNDNDYDDDNYDDDYDSDNDDENKVKEVNNNFKKIN